MKPIHLVDSEKGSIHLIDGEKGGVGKSTESRSFIEYVQDILLLDPALMEIIDADKDQPLIGRTYAPQHYLKEGNDSNSSLSEISSLDDLAKQIAMIYFTDNEKILSQTDIILELASTKAVVVNLPAAVFSLVNRWLNEGGILQLATAINIPIYKWFVTDGCQETIDTLKKSYLLYDNKINHIIVKNRGLASIEQDWWAFERDEELQLYLDECKDTTYTIDLPRLTVPTSAYEAFKKLNVPLREVSDRKRAKELGFPMTQSGRFKMWRDASFESLSTLPWAEISEEFSSKNKENSADSNSIDENSPNDLTIVEQDD